MTIISKTAGVAGLASSLVDIHKTAVLYANNGYAKASGNAYLSCAVGSQKTDRLSVKDSDRKNWLLKNNFLIGIKSTLGKIGGYIKGFGRSSVEHAPELGLSLISLFVRNKRLANIGALALGLYELYDFIRNSTGLFDKTDYLNIK